jgi:hypothetical protein
MRSTETRSRAIRLTVILSLAAATLLAGDAAPDLRLRWKEPSVPIHGRTGTKVDLAYELTNIGASGAFAVIVKAQTSLGPIGAPARIQPGPDAGATLQRKVSFVLARGMREICVDAVLQLRSGSDPPEPNLANNRVCRPLTVDPQSASEEVSR